MTSDELVERLSYLLCVTDFEDSPDMIYEVVKSLNEKYSDLQDLMKSMMSTLRDIGEPMTNAEICAMSPRYDRIWGKTIVRNQDDR